MLLTSRNILLGDQCQYAIENENTMNTRLQTTLVVRPTDNIYIFFNLSSYLIKMIETIFIITRKTLEREKVRVACSKHARASKPFRQTARSAKLPIIEPIRSKKTNNFTLNMWTIRTFDVYTFFMFKKKLIAFPLCFSNSNLQNDRLL